ncbi:MAG: 4-hydroxythreonine-4-phosphate dehydrogenase [Granulosicoccus sp.]
MIKRLVYTAGEPAGIGPDLAILYALQTEKNSQKNNVQFAVIANAELLLQRAHQLQCAVRLVEIHPNDEPYALKKGELGIIPIQTNTSVTTGRLNKSNAPYVLQSLDLATQLCLNHQCHGVVTGPVQKSIINDAGIPFSGHTEYFAEKTHTQQVVMMLATEGLRVALATTHLPLKDVSQAITHQSLLNTLRIIHNDMRGKFMLETPSIAVCGLNPHAGESGHLGREEIDIIIPVLQQLKTEGIHCQGPLPADTLFTPKYLDHVDVVLAMYHDQGLPVLKYKGFGAAANITLGLPIIRTSVDHGTALDLAGTGNIDTGSLSTAIQYALAMTPPIRIAQTCDK